MNNPKLGKYIAQQEIVENIRKEYAKSRKLDIIDDTALLGRMASQKLVYEISITVKDTFGAEHLDNLIIEAGTRLCPYVRLSELLAVRDHYTIGTGWQSGMLDWPVKGIVKRKDIRRVVDFFDYLEISGDKTPEAMKYNKKIIKYGKHFRKPVVT